MLPWRSPRTANPDVTTAPPLPLRQPVVRAMRTSPNSANSGHCLTPYPLRLVNVTESGIAGPVHRSHEHRVRGSISPHRRGAPPRLSQRGDGGIPGLRHACAHRRRNAQRSKSPCVCVHWTADHPMRIGSDDSTAHGCASPISEALPIRFQPPSAAIRHPASICPRRTLHHAPPDPFAVEYRSPCLSSLWGLCRKVPKRPPPRQVDIVKPTYQPSKAEPNEDVRISAAFEEAVDALTRPVEINYTPRPPRRG